MILSLIFIISIKTSVFADTNTNNNNNNLNIVIDGKFGDWQDKPITDLTTNGDSYNIKKASLLADDKYIYFYLDMASTNGSGYNTLQTSGYLLQLAGHSFWLTFSQTFPSDANNIGNSKNITVTAWDKTDSKNYQLGSTNAIETRLKVNNSYSDAVEMAIPYSDLGLDSTIQDSISITIHNDNLGSQTITTTGGSTGPIFIIVIGLCISLLALIKYKKHQNNRGKI